MALNSQQLIDHHAQLRDGWVKRLEMFEAGALFTKRQLVNGELSDATAETIHFIRQQLTILDALDRLLQRP